ncbi:MAG: EAL domain-containing protein [Natronospirillum sp.]|uniref:putative bifunctional diguanylate cyclase/phosphodiesterase n=1 Tax=Natronospirillum sp. TaxID=2812955 RepID=UPI0025E15AAA|nr:bifunctional diguanylate cyclase/phosphodiesterase [Natronospirillum sp.]MCH8550307.1 EAL domain-containing protein [Natronospirillum sp.]
MSDDQHPEFTEARQLSRLQHSLQRLDLGALVLDQSRKIRYISPAAESLRQAVSAPDWSALLPAELESRFDDWLISQIPWLIEQQFDKHYLRWEAHSDQTHQFVIMYCTLLPERENYRRILEYSVDGIYQTSRSGEIVYANRSLARLFGYATPEEMQVKVGEVSQGIYRHQTDREAFLRQLQEHGEVIGFECEMFGKDGRTVWVRQNARAILDDEGELAHIIGTVADVSALRQAELARERAESDYERLFNSAQAGLYQSLPDGRLLRANQMLAQIIGYASPEELLASVKNLGEDVYDDSRTRDRVIARLRHNGHLSNERVRLRRRDGRRIWVLLSAQFRHHDNQKEDVFEGSMHDITEQVEAEENFRYLAEHDPLTGLLNRSRFQSRLQEISQFIDDTGAQAGWGVIFLDLDHFKDINDTLGHLVGDVLLEEIARRLRAPLSLEVEPFRLGGDEFAIIVPHSVDVTALDTICTEIIDRVSQPYRHQEHALKVTASLGVVLSEQLQETDGEDISEAAMRAADLALYSCKRSGRAGYRVFEVAMQLQVQQERDLETRLEAALKNNELELHYQPSHDADSNRIVGVEALLRWPTEWGMISPSQFIPLAERSGLIADIDQWVFQQVCLHCERLTALHPQLRVNFNLSAHHFNYDTLDQLMQPLDDALDRWGSNLGIELTERVMFEHTDQVIAALQSLRARGISISLDDFGTGYSSLSYLTRLPVDRLKIDQSFIRDMDRNSTALTVVQATVQIGKTLNMRVTAEGVETAEQLAFVRELGVDEVQGFYLARPMPLDDLLQMLALDQTEDA